MGRTQGAVRTPSRCPSSERGRVDIHEALRHEERRWGGTVRDAGQEHADAGATGDRA